MIREDFLIRMIKQLAEVIARIMGLVKEAKYDEATAALEDAYRSFVGMPRSMLDRLDPETVVRTVGAEKAMIIAALLDAEATMPGVDGGARAARANAIRVAAGLPTK